MTIPPGQARLLIDKWRSESQSARDSIAQLEEFNSVAPGFHNQKAHCALLEKCADELEELLNQSCL